MIKVFKLFLFSFFILIPLAHSSPNVCRGKTYPAVWWKEFDKKTAPDWEILPQEAKPCEVVLSKRTDLGILSNFAHTPFKFKGKVYPSLEGFWQMMKFPEGPDDERVKDPSIKWPYTREQVSQMTGFDAKKAGSAATKIMEKLGIDWVTFEGKKMKYRSKNPGMHYRLIWNATLAKVRQNKDVKTILLSTGDLKLIPDHHQKPDSPPEWKYFELFMKIRDTIGGDSRLF